MQAEMSKDQSTLMDLTGLISNQSVSQPCRTAGNEQVALNQQEAQALASLDEKRMFSFREGRKRSKSQSVRGKFSGQY